jgi:phosphatidylglycerophosphate synthase
VTLSKYVTVPNALSASRVVFLPIAYVFAAKGMEIPFVITYTVLGLTDLFDGLAARWLKQTSEIGKTLDAVADLVYYVSSAVFLAWLHMDYLRPNMAFLYVFFGLLGLSLVVSWIRCGVPTLMHTWTAKVAATLVFLGVICSSFFDTTVFLTVIIAVYSLAFVEEILIFVIHGDIDPDSPSIFRVRPKPKKA